MDINFFIIIFFTEFLIFLGLIYLLIKVDDWVCQKEIKLKKEAKQLLFIVVTSKEMLRAFNKNFNRILGLNAFDITGFVYFLVQLHADIKKLTKIKGGFLAKLYALKIISMFFKNKNRFRATIAKYSVV
jgi:hypothetical protein